MSVKSPDVSDKELAPDLQELESESNKLSEAEVEEQKHQTTNTVLGMGEQIMSTFLGKLISIFGGK